MIGIPLPDQLLLADVLSRNHITHLAMCRGFEDHGIPIILRHNVTQGRHIIWRDVDKAQSVDSGPRQVPSVMFFRLRPLVDVIVEESCPGASLVVE